ncbi:MAG: PKD domain-containing protein [Candidatus Zambryskibacteria bacterium]|nr:PKD domain-containing protein [Candidatus Zambryskibacteria bacterium]
MHYFYKVFFRSAFLWIIFPLFVYAQGALVNINTADSTGLQTLNGVGPVKAAAIIGYRNLNGPFETIEEIKNVSGIGEVTYANIKDYITIGDPPSASVQNTSTSAPNNSASSVHYGSVPISNTDKGKDVYISAGRDRLGTAGSPMEFAAKTDLDYTKSSIFKWNFGDGSQSGGSILNHTYEYAGEYVVVLNVSLPSGQAISRINVKIINPEVTVSLATADRIELKNSSKNEVNLYGRVLWSGAKTFVFPQDTIVGAGQSISFSSKVTGLRPDTMRNVTIMVIGDTEQNKLWAKIEEQRSKEIINLEKELGIIEEKLANIYNSVPQNIAKDIPTTTVSVEPIFREDDEARTSTAVRSGWFDVFKHFFLRTK